MAGLVRDDVAEDRASQQIEIADQVEHLVAGEFVGEAQRRVNHLLIVDQDQIVQPPAAGEAHLGQLVKLVHEAEGARRCDLRACRPRAR